MLYSNADQLRSHTTSESAKERKLSISCKLVTHQSLENVVFEKEKCIPNIAC